MTVIIAISILAAGAPVLAVIVATLLQNKRLTEIHILVNSQLSNALEEIASLKLELAKLTRENSDER